MSDAKGPPVAGEVTTNDTRAVRIKLSNCSRTADPLTGYTFVPDGLYLEWHNGVLVHCTLVGPRLRADGGRFLDDRRTGRPFIRRKFTLDNRYPLDGDTPDWVRELVARHAPDGVLAIP